MDNNVAHLGGVNGDVHGLHEHLKKVADGAAVFAGDWGRDWAYLAGLWHDIGKYNPEFQAYIRRVATPDAHLEDPDDPKPLLGPDHSTAGAQYATQRFEDVKMGVAGRILAYIIAGHHAGLADWQDEKSLHHRLSTRGAECLAKVKHLVPEEILNASLPTSSPPSREGLALWIRMLFSSVVDADFLDTESYMQGNVGRGEYPEIDALLERYHVFMTSKNTGDSAVNRIRSEILRECLDKANEPSGFFTLSVPTGGGKTLASLGFALEHAKKHGKKRIIYVIPYTSIIEQTADVFREVLGAEVVVEHHSQFEPSSVREEASRQRLATENWDAPIIVTTNVQFFESLYATRTSKTRKLHNITNSVVILDEAQMLPPELLDPVRHVMQELMQHYGVTMVLSTATQPVLADPPLEAGAIKHTVEMMTPREIIKDPKSLYSDLKRVQVEPRSGTVEWVALAEELTGYEQVLCIVSQRDDCRELHGLMREGTVHLSALMCGAHRSEVIERIKQDLKADKPVRVISTQLVEAGVDLDFPVVYRAMAGLDAIAQAAGRCNREGKRELGKVVVFEPPKGAPKGLLAKAADAGAFVLRSITDDMLQPKHFTAYFDEFYGAVARSSGYDAKGVLSCLKSNQLAFEFRQAAHKFQMIDDTYLPVIVMYGKGAELISVLRRGTLDSVVMRTKMREAQRYTITIPKPVHEKLLAAGEIKEVEGLSGVYVQDNLNLYDGLRGFLPDAALDYVANGLVV